MKVIKRSKGSIKKEPAHGGSGYRKVLVNQDVSENPNFEAMTYGYLPVGQIFDWHDHEDIEEIMFVIKGEGEVHDEDGLYSYESGDLFVFPANIQHKIINTSDIENELIFIRTKIS